MRILGFSEEWGKLKNEWFTTFRFARCDRDWQVGEVVKVVLQPRKIGGGKLLGTAEIISKEPRWIPQFPTAEALSVFEEEAKADGFGGVEAMYNWMYEKWGAGYGMRLYSEPMNKLTLRWANRT